MDLAYDHIQESALSQDSSNENAGSSTQKNEQPSLNTDFQEAYKAISSSPWGAKLGGFFGSVVKQVSGEASRLGSCLLIRYDRAKASIRRPLKN
jgi:hypothetical protein